MIACALCKFVYYLFLDAVVLNCWSNQEVLAESNMWVNGLHLSDSNEAYYVGDTINFTCEHNYDINYTMSLKQTIGNEMISFPSRVVKQYTISVILDRFDDASTWTCSLFKDASLTKNYDMVYFQTKERPDKDRVKQYYQNEVKYYNKCNTRQYTIDKGKIIKLNSKDGNICIEIVSDSNPEIANYKRKVMYKKKPFLTLEEEEQSELAQTAMFNITSSTSIDNQDGKNDSDKSIIWKAGVSAGLLFLVVVTVFTVKSYRKRHKNAPVPEGLYATTNELVYAEIQISETSVNCTLRNNQTPYAQVIGVLMPKKKQIK